MSRLILLLLLITALPCCNRRVLHAGEGFVEVEGGRVWYRIVGSGDATPLLLLHGGPGAPSHYLNPLAAIAADRPVIFYDQLGAGRSEQPTDSSLWRVDRFVDELAKVRRDLNLDQVHLHGHSWGSMLAVEYLLTKPAGVKSLILASPALSISRWTEDAKQLLTQLPAEMQRQIEQHELAGTTDSDEYQAAVFEYYRRFLCRTDPWPDDLNVTFEQFNGDLYRQMWGPAEWAATGSLANFERAGDLSKLDMPILFTTGRYDEATPETVAAYQAMAPGSQLVIFENSAHMTMLDEPEAYVQALREFLAAVE